MNHFATNILIDKQIHSIDPVHIEGGKRKSDKEYKSRKHKKRKSRKPKSHKKRKLYNRSKNCKTKRLK